MPTPTVINPTSRPAVGLTGKGRAAALLISVRERWEQLSPDQQAECEAILQHLSVAMRRDVNRPDMSAPRPLPLVGRLSA
jgi:hypothetical protein